METQNENEKNLTQRSHASSEMKHADLTHKVIGCAMEVHKTLGNGFQEVIYQRSLAIEFDVQKMAFVREDERAIFYKNFAVRTRRVDFFIENIIPVQTFP